MELLYMLYASKIMENLLQEPQIFHVEQLLELSLVRLCLREYRHGDLFVSTSVGDNRCYYSFTGPINILKTIEAYSVVAISAISV